MNTILVMKNIYSLLIVIVVCACTEQNNLNISSRLRAPAYPLINIDAYTNAWLFGDKLFNKQPTHWTGKEFPLLGAVRVDEKAYRFMGVENNLLKPLEKMSEGEGWIARFVNEEPPENWNSRNFDDNRWKLGKAAFGKRENQDINSSWDSENIWVRREFALDYDLSGKKVFLEYSHDDDVEIFINGIEVVRIYDRCQDNVLMELSG